MYTNNYFKINKINLLNFLISLIPLNLIIGSVAVNLNIILICVLGFFIFKKEIFVENNKNYTYLIYFFFIYLIIVTFYNYFFTTEVFFQDKNSFFKSIFYLRFLLIFLILKKLIETDNFNYKFFFISSSICSCIIGLDLIYQFSFGKNILGYNIVQNRPSSFFGTETIAGGYLQKFSLFFLYIIFMNETLKKKQLIFFISLIFFFFAILITNNRMPLIIFLLSIILIFILNKNFKFLFFSLLITSVLFTFSYNSNKKIRNAYNSFYYKTSEVLKFSPNLFIHNKIDVKLQASEYLFLFNSGIQIWKENKIFGHGIKSFRKKCVFDSTQLCSSHPHNYFIEIMVETGLIGLFLIYLFLILNFKKTFTIIFNNNKNFYLIPFFIVLLFEFFPLRSTGSFFTTNNSTIIFIFLGVLSGVCLKKSQNNC